jgi:cell fate regulator YaaT (PSP1 superfamily)
VSCSTCPLRENLSSGKENPDIGCNKLQTYDWLKNIPDSGENSLYIEVKFKNTHKDFYINKNNIALKQGDYVAVESDRGHDIGRVSLTGRLVNQQLKRKKLRSAPERIIYRIASKADIEKWQVSKLKEKTTMLRARQIAAELKLNMKISDVEYQGDGSKAIFYYIAEERVDFRMLIKRYAREFNIRIEMKQIGARQEAALVGGIGSCGKELCCSSWRTNLSTVISNAAKIQELPHNAQKLTGQCGKLKCCLMYELDSYLESQNDFPDVLLELEMENGIAYPKKKDILNRLIYYSFSKHDASKSFALSIDKVKEVINLNKRGIKPKDIINETGFDSDKLDFVTSESDLDIKHRKEKNHKYSPSKLRKQKKRREKL